MKSTILITGLTAIVAGCATAPAVRTQSVPEEGRVSTRAESVQDKFSRLEELDPKSKFKGGATSFEEYVMSEGTRLELGSIAGIYAGKIQVITDGEGHFLSEGSYAFYRNIEATRKALQEADANSDGIITSDEAEELSRKVMHQYAQVVSKEEFKQRVCDANKTIQLSRCEFPHMRSSSHCEFNCSREKGDVEFGQHREDSDCEFNAFRNNTNPQPCKDKVAAEYKAKAERAKQTYTVCVEQSEAAFATCTAEAEKAHQQCLSGNIEDLYPIPQGKGMKMYKDGVSTWGVDETSEPPELFERVHDDGK